MLINCEFMFYCVHFAFQGTFVIGVDGTEIFEQSDEYNEYNESDER